MDLLSVKDLGTQLVAWTKERRPFSMVRLGDGEFAVLKYPMITDTAMVKRKIGRWFDVSTLGKKHFRSIRNEIRRACNAADFLGVPSINEQKRYPKWKRFQKFCKKNEVFGPHQQYFHFYAINKLWTQGYLMQMLHRQDLVYCIAGRDVSRALERVCTIGKVVTHLVAPEKFVWRGGLGIGKANAGYQGKPHYPQQHEELLRWLATADYKGHIFLVGAGGLGKEYCNCIKQHGGMALDVGALFDGWAGLASRPWLKAGIERFRIV